MNKQGPSRGDHEDPQKPTDRKTEPGNKPDYRALRDQVFINLYNSMNISMKEMANQDLHNSVRVKWAHCLAQTVAAFCNLIRTFLVLASEELGDEDLASFLAKVSMDVKKLEEEAAKAPKKYRDPEYTETLSKKLRRGFIWHQRRSRLFLVDYDGDGGEDRWTCGGSNLGSDSMLGD